MVAGPSCRPPLPPFLHRFLLLGVLLARFLERGQQPDLDYEEQVGKVDLGLFDTPQVRLNLSSFTAYGSHEVEIECQFDGRATVYAIDLLAEGDFDILLEQGLVEE